MRSSQLMKLIVLSGVLSAISVVALAAEPSKPVATILYTGNTSGEVAPCG